MKKILLIMLVMIPALVAGQETVKYDYMTIVQAQDEIRIREGEKFELIKIRKEKEGDDDFRPILKIVEENELKNWEVFEVDINNERLYEFHWMTFIIRRVKGYVGNENE